jgi:hypothetical protein
MQPGYGPGKPEGELQERSHRHRLTEQPLQRLATRVLQHKRGPTAFAPEFERPHRPRSVELILQSVFVGEALEDVGRRLLCGGQHGQHGAAIAIGARAPSSAEHAMFAVLPQDLETVVSPAEWNK